MELMAAIWLIFAAAGLLLNGILTSELGLKTAMQSDLAAARRIQDTLHPHAQLVLPGYDIGHSYTPDRAVGGDYFDVVELRDGRTLFAMADVAGKGMPAALLAGQRPGDGPEHRRGRPGSVESGDAHQPAPQPLHA